MDGKYIVSRGIAQQPESRRRLPHRRSPTDAHSNRTLEAGASAVSVDGHVSAGLWWEVSVGSHPALAAAPSPAARPVGHAQPKLYAPVGPKASKTTPHR